MCSKLARMRGKVVMVTGANSGIGRETALELARLGAHVVCVCRDKTRGEEVVREIRAVTGATDEGRAELGLCDLSSQKSIREFADSFVRTHDKLDVLVNNAGLIVPERKTTVDGHELTFGLNHLGYFLLTDRLLPLLEKSAPARIVNVSSHAQRMLGRIVFDDLMFEKKYSSMRAYSQSKLANCMFTYDLADKLKGKRVTVNAVHPGPVATGFGGQFKPIMGFVFGIGRAFMRTPKKGAETVIWAASAPEVAETTGKYFFDREAVDSVPFSYDMGNRKQLWQVSEKLTGITPGAYGQAA